MMRKNYQHSANRLARVKKKTEYKKQWIKDNPERHAINQAKARLVDRPKQAERARKKNKRNKDNSEYKIKRKEISRRYYQNNKFKAIARTMVSKAVSKGTIKPLNYCEGCLMVYPVQAHHHDYYNPLSVIWLCKSCHRIIENVKHREVKLCKSV